MIGRIGVSGGLMAMGMAAGAAAACTDADLAALSGYTWRGQAANDEAVFQPALNVGKGSFTGNVWGNVVF